MSSKDIAPLALEELRAKAAHEQAAREAAEAQLRQLVETSLIGIGTCDFDGRLLEANDAFLRMLGSSRDDLRARSIDLIKQSPPAMREIAYRSRSTVFETGSLPPRETELFRADGKAVPILLSAARVPGREAMALFALDLTESRRKDAAIRSAEMRLGLLLEALPVMLTEYQRDGTITLVEGAEKVGLPSGQGQSLFTRWAERPDLIGLAQRALEGEVRTARVEVNDRTFDVTFRPITSVNGAPASSALSASVEVTDAVRAIEEKRRLQDWLVQSHQLDGFGMLAAGLAHTFNNLLAGVLANASVASQALQADHPSAVAVADLLTSATRAVRLGQQLMQAAVPSAPEPRPIDLSSRLREMLPLFTAAIPRNSRLELELSEGLPLVLGHTDQLRRALVPLLTAAIDSTRARGGIIRISTRLTESTGSSADGALVGGDRLQPGWYVGVSVSDDGPALDPKSLAALNGPLLGSLDQPPGAASSSTRALGLAAVLGSMRTQRGGVRITSDSLENRVELLYPVPDLPPQAIPVRAPAGPATSREVLIVDDDPIVLRAAARILRPLHLTVSTASTGDEALERLANGANPGLVLLDFAMPGMNGEQTLFAIKQLRPDTRVLLWSGYTQEEATWQIESRHPGLLSGFVAKPFTATSLQQAVLRALDGDLRSVPQG